MRELNLLEGRACGGPLKLSEGHLLMTLQTMGEAKVQDLAGRLLLDKSTVSRICAGLEARDLVTCRSCSGDRRRKMVSLTEAGRKEIETLDSLAQHQVEQALTFVAEAELDQVTQGLDRYSRALTYARLSRDYILRPIAPDDVSAVAALIREIMTEFGAVGPGYSIEDPEVDDMYSAYSDDRAAFFVIERGGEILGCGGIGPLAGADERTCELRKMYFRPQLRGLGLGTRLLNVCPDAARTAGYQICYLETLESMHHARKLYAKHGFEPLDAPMGCTGHSACDSWMAKDLVERSGN